MKNLENIKVLNESELKMINGGSELTDSFWYGVGAVVGYTRRTLEIWGDAFEQGIFSK